MKPFHCPTGLCLRVLLSLLSAAALLASPAPVLGQPAFPSKAVTLVVPFTPGGSTDIIARAVQPKLSELLGQPVIIDNRPGASGVIATNYVAKSAHDGYTLFFSWDMHTINPVVMKSLPYDTFKDFVPITLLARLPLVMGAWAGLPANNVAEFIALAKSQPGKFNYASVGSGSSNRLHSENLHRLAQIEVVHIPYKGGLPSVQAMMTGEVAYSFLSYGTLRGQIQAGKLKALAVTGDKRSPELPNVPTMIESGFPGFEAYAWIGIFAPAGTPETTVSRLHHDFVAALADPEVAKRLAAAGAEAIGSTPQELDRWVRTDYEKWRKFAAETKLRFDD